MESNEKADDLQFPLSVIGRLIKEALPKDTHISKNVKNIVAQWASIYILFLTENASKVSKKLKRKTILPDDILTALKMTGFTNFTDDIIDIKQSAENLKKTNEENILDTVNIDEDSCLNEIIIGKKRDIEDLNESTAIIESKYLKEN